LAVPEAPRAGDNATTGADILLRKALRVHIVAVLRQIVRALLQHGIKPGLVRDKYILAARPVVNRRRKTDTAGFRSWPPRDAIIKIDFHGFR
jgi:hypothetical protein